VKIAGWNDCKIPNVIQIKEKQTDFFPRPEIFFRFRLMQRHFYQATSIMSDSVYLVQVDVGVHLYSV
jgi:hypothetical protein